jgi:hypothetical protein
LALAAAGLAIVRPRDKWQTGAGVGAGILVPMIATIVVDYQRDPTSHNLLPLELAIGLALGMPPALLGALLGGLTARVRFIGWPVGGVIAAVGLMVAAVHAPIVLARTVASESDAVARIRSLVAAQDRFRSASPALGFSCDLNKLGEGYAGPVRRLAPARRQVEGPYDSGTVAPAGHYDFALQCGRERRPMIAYLLMAAPRQGAVGRWIYCAEADGRILRARRHRNNFCLKEGVPVVD